MPNWCSNQLDIHTKTEKELDEVLEFIKGRDEEGKEVPIWFDSICPTPEKLLDASERDGGIERLHKILDGSAKDYLNWHEFRLGEWGTKWNPSCFSISDPCTNNSETSIRIDFNTAWGPPIHIMEKLDEKYPDIKFSLSFIEEGCAFAGRYITGEGESCHEAGDSEYDVIKEDDFGWDWVDEDE